MVSSLNIRALPQSCLLFLALGLCDVSASPCLVSWSPTSGHLYQEACPSSPRWNSPLLPLYTLLYGTYWKYIQSFLLFTGLSSMLNLRWYEILPKSALWADKSGFNSPTTCTYMNLRKTWNFFKLLFLPLQSWNNVVPAWEAIIKMN